MVAAIINHVQNLLDEDFPALDVSVTAVVIIVYLRPKDGTA